MPVASAPRVVGIDVARGVAIIGMFVAHAIPRADGTELLADGRSSILFATLAGVSLGIMTGGDDPLPRGRRADRLTSIVLRALILFLVGVLLATIGSEIAIILDYYAIMFLTLLPVLFLPRRALAGIAAVLVFAAPALAAFVGDERAGTPQLLFFLQYYFLTGYYPVLIWLPFLIAGLICARSGLAESRTQGWMIGVGAAASVLGYGAAAIIPGVSAEAHSGSPAEVIGSGGLAIAVIGALLWVTSPDRARFGRVIRTVTWPIAATGAMALTIYTLQIITLAVFARLRDDSGGIEYPGWPLLIGMSAVSILFASLWRAFLGKGPFERVMSLLTTARRSGNSRRADPIEEGSDSTRR